MRNFPWLTYFLLSITFNWCVNSNAQTAQTGYASSETGEIDSLYIMPLTDLITTRLYLSQKVTSLELTDNQEFRVLSYLPNTSLNLGVGATVKSVTLNLAYGFNFLNPDEGQGKTRYLDLQSHIYTRKLVIDFFGQFYKGMYLENTLELKPDFPTSYYLRPDIYEQILGLTGYYVFNNEKYSYRAALIQNERQLKSAGSWLVGIEAYYGLVNADSALVPGFLKNIAFQEMDGVERLSFLKAGPSAGYTYTLVVAKKFFAMLSLTLNYGIGFNKAYNPELGTLSDFQGDFGAFGRFGLGYNDTNWYFGFTGVANAISTSTDSRLLNTDYSITNVRLNFVKRFKPGPKLMPWFKKVP